MGRRDGPSAAPATTIAVITAAIAAVVPALVVTVVPALITAVVRDGFVVLVRHGDLRHRPAAVAGAHASALPRE